MIVGRRAPRTQFICAAGRSASTIRSILRGGADRRPPPARVPCPLRGRSRAAGRASYAPRLRARWIEAGADPGMGRPLHVWDPFGYPARVLHRDEQLRPSTQRFDLHRGAPMLRFDHLNLHTPRLEEALAFWQRLGFRCSEYISTDGGRRADHRRLDAAQADRSRHRADRGRGAAAAPFRVLGRGARRRAARVRSARRRPALGGDRARARAATASRTHSSSTSAIPTAIASSCTPATTTPAIPTTSRCAGRSTIRAAVVLGRPAPDSWYEESSPADRARRSVPWPSRPRTSTSATSAAEVMA